MAKIDQDLILYLEKLSDLQLTASERESIMLDLNKILSHIDKLQNCNTQGVEPLVHLSPSKDVWREDIIDPGLNKGALLTRAKNHLDQYYVVPKLIES